VAESAEAGGERPTEPERLAARASLDESPRAFYDALAADYGAVIACDNALPHLLEHMHDESGYYQPTVTAHAARSRAFPEPS
jgi:hypothetical protein